MALAGVLARTATRLLRGGLQPFVPSAAVPALSLGISRQLCDAPAAEESPAAEEDESWKEAEVEILCDVEPIMELVGSVLSGRYGYGGFLSPVDQKVVVEKLLSHHPRSEEKIGCGVDAIMVAKHPNYRNSSCLFVLRTNGDLEDFSYRKCSGRTLKGNIHLMQTGFFRNILFQGGGDLRILRMRSRKSFR